ncbi:hypothetical protein ACM61V_13060 [Sphingomonas sp. TX0543]|uniref:hypothetical protein n=1 Tax=unclassified Sphingomonas TaxID=196159 RepID=UPI0010F4AD6E|nr:hypothetical protein [Sphingomonas sp. 3P27F8]
MPIHTLIPHPDFPPLAVRGVSVAVAGSHELELMYRVEGGGQIVWPNVAIPQRADDLWKTTCFELFLRPECGTGYVEFNFSPSGRWAAYAFAAYRAGAGDLARAIEPHVERAGTEISVRCDLADLPPVPMRMALTAVIEEAGGRRSFWSLAHPPGPPDFHHDDCFVARLPAPERP